MRGKVIGLPDAQLHLARADPPAAAHLLGAEHGDRDDRRRRSPGPGGRRRASASASEPRSDPRPLGEDADGAAPRRAPAARSPSPSRRTAPRRIGKAPTRERIHPCQRRSNSSTLATYFIGRRQGRVAPITNGSRKLRWLEATIRPPLIPRSARGRSARGGARSRKSGLKDHARQQVEGPVDAVPARVVVVALEALLADHLVRAWRRGLGRASSTQMRTRPGAPRYWLDRRGCATEAAASEALPGSSTSAGARRDRADRGVPSSGRARIASSGSSQPARGRRRGRPAGVGRRRAPRSARRIPPGSVPSAAASDAIASGARGAHRVHRQRAASSRWSPRGGAAAPGRASGRRRGGGRSRPSRARRRRGASRGRARRGRARRAGWSSAAAISSAPRRADQRRDRVGERRVERVGAVGERVHRAGPQAAVVEGGHLERVGDHQGGADEVRAPRARGPAGSRWMAVISAPDSVVGIAQTRPPRTAAIAFAVSITRPPPSATRVGLRTESMIAAAASGTGPRGTSWTALARSASSSGAAPERARGGQQLEALPDPAGEELGRVGERALAGRRSSARRRAR